MIFRIFLSEVFAVAKVNNCAYCAKVWRRCSHIWDQVRLYHFPDSNEICYATLRKKEEGTVVVFFPNRVAKFLDSDLEAVKFLRDYVRDEFRWRMKKNRENRERYLRWRRENPPLDMEIL